MGQSQEFQGKLVSAHSPSVCEVLCNIHLAFLSDIRVFSMLGRAIHDFLIMQDLAVKRENAL